jgi:RNA polymerase sigma-70 factor (ECF subfamily)
MLNTVECPERCTGVEAGLIVGTTEKPGPDEHKANIAGGITAVCPRSNEEYEVYDELIRNNQRRIFLLIYKLVRNRADAQDLTQDTFLLAFQRYGQIKDVAKSAQWVSSIARNIAISFLRRNRLPHREMSDDIPEVVAKNVEEALIAKEQLSALANGLACLSERQCMALCLRDLSELPSTTVASQMKCSEATVRTHIAHAREKLKRHLVGQENGIGARQRQPYNPGKNIQAVCG